MSFTFKMILSLSSSLDQTARRQSPVRSRFRCTRGFTLVELLLVVAIMTIMVAVLAFSVTGIKDAGRITRAGYDVAGLLENARAYARANNTYVWVGFFEEDATKNPTTPATAGRGRVIIATVACADGTYPDGNAGSVIDPTKLVMVRPLVRINNAQLASFTPGNGTGATFETRPSVASDTARIGTSASSNLGFSFQYPLGTASKVQYTFTNTIQFSPRGEASLAILPDIQPLVEIGLRPTHGATVDTVSKNLVAIQLTGITGNVTIYR